MSVGANPFIYDEDKDGLSDGEEIATAQYLEYSTNISARDSNDDGIVNIAEWSVYFWDRNKWNLLCMVLVIFELCFQYSNNKIFRPYIQELGGI